MTGEATQAVIVIVLILKAFKTKRDRPCRKFKSAAIGYGWTSVDFFDRRAGNSVDCRMAARLTVQGTA